jgi:hydrogenase maturation protease
MSDTTAVDPTVSDPMPVAPHPGADTDRAEILVLGVGNELFTDEGLGCVAARMLAELELPGVDVLDEATLGIALLPEIADRTALLLLDAIVRHDAAPGDLVVLRGQEVPANRNLTVSAHQIGISEALATAELAGRSPRRLAAVGMVPVCLETGYGVSDTVQDRLPAMIEQARAILRDWDVPGA